MTRLPSTPRLDEGASFTELVRRVASMHQLSDARAVNALKFHTWPRGGPSALDVIGFTPEQVGHLRATTGMDASTIEALTLPASYPALARVRTTGNEADRYGKSWDSAGIFRTDAPVCVLCVRENRLVFPLVWRLSFQPVCIRHEVYLSPTCARCGRFPGRPLRTHKFEPHCRDGCVLPSPQPAEKPVIAAQARLRALMTGHSSNDNVLRATLDFAWYLRHHPGTGTRAKRDAPSPHETGRILVLATDWSTREPEYVGTRQEFLAVSARTLLPGRPFASPSLKAAFYTSTHRTTTEPANVLAPRTIARVDVPHYLPLDLHIKHTADLIHDGWARQNPPDIQTSRLIAAHAVNSSPGRWRTRSAAAVAKRLEERGQLEVWLTALEEVRTELAHQRRVFGATWDDIETFAANFSQDGEASLPLDSAIHWFLRDHRCVNFGERLGWSASRRSAAANSESRARRQGTCGPWELIEQRLVHAATIADRNHGRDAQTA